MNFYRLLFLFIFLTLMNVCFATTLEAKKFISISDIHFDPTAGCELSLAPCPMIKELIREDYQTWDAIFEKYVNTLPIKYYKDTNYALLKSLLIQLEEITKENKIQFVLVLGDFLDHDLQSKFKKFSLNKSHESYIKFVKKTMQYITFKLLKTFPRTNIYPILGNNDTYGKDYSMVPQGNFLSDLSLSLIWSHSIDYKLDWEAFVDTFKKGGYYSVKIDETTKIIVLNTVLFSPKSQTKPVKHAAVQQLNWLHSELELARRNHQSVLIACHIPVGIDIYLSSTMPFKIIKNFWAPQYTTQFLKLMKDYTNNVVGVLPGHVHIDLFQFTIKGENNADIPMIFTPSVSPIFGNNPAIKVFNYQSSPFKLESFDRYYKPLNDPSGLWQKGNRFNGIHQTKCQYCYLSDVVQHLIMNNYLLDVLMKYYSGIQDDKSDDNDKFSYYWCSLYSNDIKTYKKCVSE